MKRVLIVALACLNLLLLAGLVVVLDRPARAQAIRGGADFLLVSCKQANSRSAVCMIDLAKRRLGAWRYDKDGRRMVSFRGRDLARDFRRD